MAVRLAASGDLAQLKTLYLASPLATLAPDIRLADVIGPNTRTVVNDAAGVITAAVVADRDDSSREKVIVYRLVMGELLAIRACLKEIALWAIGQGYDRWIANIPQGAQFNPTRTFDKGYATWPYLHDDPNDPRYDGGQAVRQVGGPLASVQVA